ncbi:MAG: SdrD B-like domain-containing protein [Thermoguttaceae bacterium]
MTDKNGQYALTGLAADTYTVIEVMKPGWQQTFPGGTNSHEVPVAQDEVVPGIDFGNFPLPGEIQGTKWHDLDNDGQKDGGEPGLEGWTIYADLNSNNDVDAGEPSDVTDANGEYTLTGLSVDTYTVREIIKPGWVQTSPSGDGSRQVPVGPGEVVPGIDFGNFQLPGAIHGAKWNDLDNDGIKDAGEPGLQGWTIYADLDGNSQFNDGEPSDVTNENGEYALTGLSADTYTVTEVMQPGWVQTLPGGTNSYDVIVGPNEVVTGIDFGNFLAQPGEIGGVKFNDLDGNGEKDAGEPGLQGWTIYADLDGNGLLDAGEPSDVTDQNGQYSLAGLAPDTYTVAEVMQDAWKQTSPGGVGTRQVPVGPDEVVLGIDFGNREIFVSIGDVSLQEGNSDTIGFDFIVTLSPASDVTVTVDYATADGTATAADGDYLSVSGTLTFDPGVTQRTITVSVGGDTDGEPDESFVVDLSNPAYATVVDGQGSGTILNDDLPAQSVFGSPGSVSVVTGSAFAVDVQYDTSDGDNTLSGLGLRLHYDSSAMSFDGLGNVLATSLFQQQDPADDTGDFDGDPATDKFVLISWVDFMSSSWPGVPLPVSLLTADFTANAGLAAGTTSRIRFSASSTAPSHTFNGQDVEVTFKTVSLDADGNGAADALTDGILMLRHLFGFLGTALTENALAGDATRTDPADVATFLDGGRTTMLDVDGNGVADALTDGILILRYLFGFIGTPLIENAMGPNATRTDPIAVAAWLDSFLPAGAKATSAKSLVEPASASLFVAMEGENLQIVTPDPPQQAVAPGDPVRYDVAYTTDPSDPTLTGLGLRIHYDSTVMVFDQMTNVLQTNIFQQQPPADDSTDFDGDPQTDKYVLFAWLDINANWPGQLPQALLTANFISRQSAADSTSVNFSASSTAATWSFDSTSARIDFAVPAAVIDRRIFYNNSMFDENEPAANDQDDDAIAFGKQALLPGFTAKLENYTSYDKGINGIMVDIAGLAAGGNLSAADFGFMVGNGSGWEDGPEPLPVTVREGAGVDGSDRVTIRWEDNAIKNQWLQVTVGVTENTGLDEPDVFYFGNAPGEAGDSAINTIVNATDEIVARNFQHSAADPALIDDPYDYNRDGLVDGTDQIIARENQTNPLTMLRLITAPVQAVGVDASEAMALPADLDWLYEFEQISKKNARQKRNSVEEAVDILLAIEAS